MAKQRRAIIRRIAKGERIPIGSGDLIDTSDDFYGEMLRIAHANTLSLCAKKIKIYCKISMDLWGGV